MGEEMKTIGLVDLSSIFWQAWHATKDQEIGAAFDISIGKIGKFRSNYDHVGVCLDSPPYFRKQISADYKAQRYEPDKAAVDQLTRVKLRLQKDGIPLFAAPGAEADDVIAAIVNQVGNDSCHIDIMTGDKDLTQLVSQKVKTISTQNGQVYDAPAVLDKFGVMPAMMRDFLALCGDKSDNVPGVPGVGPRTACALIKQFGNVETLINAAETSTTQFLTLKPAQQDAIINNLEQLRMSLELVTLVDDLPIDVELLFNPPKLQTITKGEGMDDLPSEHSNEVLPPIDPTVESSIVAVDSNVKIVQGNDGWNRQLEPTTTMQAWKLACTLTDSRLYTKFPNAEAIMAIVLRGRALGLDATTALDGFMLVEGRPTPSAHIIIGLVMRSPLCEYFDCIHTDNERAVYETRRIGRKPLQYEYTFKMAEQAELTMKTQKGKKTNWHKRPDAMLRKTAAVCLARIVYPDVIGGLYSHEEMDGAL